MGISNILRVTTDGLSATSVAGGVIAIPGEMALAAIDAAGALSRNGVEAAAGKLGEHACHAVTNIIPGVGAYRTYQHIRGA